MTRKKLLHSAHSVLKHFPPGPVGGYHATGGTVGQPKEVLKVEQGPFQKNPWPVASLRSSPHSHIRPGSFGHVEVPAHVVGQDS